MFHGVVYSLWYLQTVSPLTDQIASLWWTKDGSTKRVRRQGRRRRTEVCMSFAFLEGEKVCWGLLVDYLRQPLPGERNICCIRIAQGPRYIRIMTHRTWCEMWGLWFPWSTQIRTEQILFQTTNGTTKPEVMFLVQIVSLDSLFCCFAFCHLWMDFNVDQRKPV